MYDYGKEKRIHPGATSGLGYEFAKLLPKKCNLILIGRNAENLKKIAIEMKEIARAKNSNIEINRN